MSEKPRICIQIVSMNNVVDLLATLQSLADLDYPKEKLDLVVFDNGSTDGTTVQVPVVLKRLESSGWSSVRFHRSEDNLGAFGGRAEASRFTPPGADYLFVLDDDVEMAPDILSVLLKTIEETGAGCVGARIVYHHDPDRTAMGAGYFNRFFGTFRGSTPETRTECHFTGACGALFDISAFETAGGFDTDYYTSHGDVDICLKILRTGRKVFYEPGAVIRHKVTEGGTRNPERIYYLYRNKILLLRKHLTAIQRIPVYIFYAVGWIPKIVLSSVIHHRGIDRSEMRAIVHALVDALFDRRGRARWISP
jgi:GT2 family glycosyltransferase